MPNTTIQLKKSSTPSAKPADLANGELAINFADGKLFYKNTAGFVAEFNPTTSSNYFGTVNANSTLLVADTPGDIVTMITGNNITIVGDAVNDRVTIGVRDNPTFTGDLSANKLTSTQSSGDEGGEIVLATAQTNNNLSTSVTIDIYQNRLRFFETGGTNRGAFIDLSIAGTGVSSNLLSTNTGGGGGGSSATIFNDQVNATRYITFADDTSGTLTRANVDVTLTYNPAANNLSVGNTVFATHFDNTSDRNLKKNIKPITNGSDVLKLNPVSFNWKATGEKSYGLIAQEVEPVIPEIVHANHDGMKTIEYVQLISLLISVVKDQQRQLDDINRRLNNMPSNP